MGVIGPGDVQWMTSGRGILHEEMPQRGPSGVIDGFQLWVNLPAAEKMSQPRYQEIVSDSVPVVEKAGMTIKVIAGEFEGVRGPVTEIAAQPLYMDVTLEPDTSFSLSVPDGHSLVTYIFEGEGLFGLDDAGEGEFVSAVRMAVFENGDHLAVQTGPGSALRFILMAGAPFRELVVLYGPFVMNTEEIQQAFADFRNGTFVQG
jgi:redox-sensitive bicupin YhaK (pirin superfamily)